MTTPSTGSSQEIEKEIETLANEIKESKQKLAALRRKMPPTEVKDYLFQGPLGNTIKLSELFGNKKELILVHNMGTQCTFCTLWADGFNGLLKHLEQRVAFAVESPDSPTEQRAFAMDRGWGFQMISSQDSPFRKDMGYVNENGSPWPGISVFTKDQGKLFRVSDSLLGPGDNFCVFWDLQDLLPSGWKTDEVDYHYSSIR